MKQGTRNGDERSEEEETNHTEAGAVIGVLIDAGVWNFLYDRRLDLARELPCPEFGLAHTREAEFEIALASRTWSASFARRS